MKASWVQRSVSTTRIKIKDALKLNIIQKYRIRADCRNDRINPARYKRRDGYYMENSILNQIPFDPACIIAGLLILVVLLLILTITTMTKVRRLDRQYDYFMRGKDAETLEDVILDQIEEIRDFKAEDRSNKDSIRTLNPESESLIPKIWACQV